MSRERTADIESGISQYHDSPLAADQQDLFKNRFFKKFLKNDTSLYTYWSTNVLQINCFHAFDLALYIAFGNTTQLLPLPDINQQYCMQIMSLSCAFPQ